MERPNDLSSSSLDTDSIQDSIPDSKHRIKRSSSGSLWDDISDLLDATSFSGETSTGQKKTLKKGVELRLRKLRREGQARWRKLVTGNENTRIRDHFGDRVDDLREKSRSHARKFVTGDASLAIEDHMKTKVVVKWMDKLLFTVGLFCFGITEFIVFKHPEVYWIWFSTIMSFLYALRIYSYTTKRWGFFMLDFCYFAVCSCIVTAVFFPKKVILNQMNFMFCNGPLLTAILAWRNSLVFHSLDKMTSIFMHFLGAILTFLSRWHPQGRMSMCNERNVIEMGSNTDIDIGTSYTYTYTAECNHLNYMTALVWPCVGYIIWQLLQIVLTEGIFGTMISNDMTLQTSIRWLCKDKRNTMNILGRKICVSTGIMQPKEEFNGEEWKSKTIFWLLQLIYTLVTLIPGIIVYHNYWLHVVWLLLVMWSCAWNGASFYIEVFASRYVKQFDDGDGDTNSTSSGGYQDPDTLPGTPPDSPKSMQKKAL